jgi:hypothetical protein
MIAALRDDQNVCAADLNANGDVDLSRSPGYPVWQVIGRGDPGLFGAKALLNEGDELFEGPTLSGHGLVTVQHY